MHVPRCLSRPVRRSQQALALLAAAMLCGCTPLNLSPNYTPKTMTALPTQRIPHCIGRYLIDLPSNFALKTGGWGEIELYYGLDKNFQRVYATVKPGRYTNEEFWIEVNKRRFELQDKKNREAKTSMLLHGEKLNNTSALLRRLPDELHAGSIKTEVHVLVGSRYVTLEQKSYSSSENLDEISYKTADPGPAETRLKMIASELLHYENAERAKPGFCMQGVLFNVGQDDERASFNFRAEDFPDVHFRVDYHAVTGQPKDGPLERTKEAYEEQPPFRSVIGTVREGKTQLAYVAAEESLTKTLRPVTQHVFIIERRDSERRTLDRPFFGLTLTTGNEYWTPVDPGNRPPDTDKVHYSPQDKVMVHREDNSSLSDEQVLKLWDEVVASVRQR
jgi:hypothetical protein